MPKQTINYALGATLVAQGVTLEEAAKQAGAKNANSLRCGLARKGVTALQVRQSDHATQRAITVATRVISQASEALRAQFANELAQTAGKLSTIPVGRSLKSLRQRAEVLEPLARTAKIVHDWGSEQPNALVVAGLFSEPKPQEQIEPATDIQAVVAEEPKPLLDKNTSSNPS